MQHLYQSPRKNKESDGLLLNPNDQSRAQNQILSDSESSAQIEPADNCDTVENIKNKIARNIISINKLKIKKQKAQDEFEKYPQQYSYIEALQQKIRKLKDENKVNEKDIAVRHALAQIKAEEKQRKNDKKQKRYIKPHTTDPQAFSDAQLEKAVEVFYNENKLYLYCLNRTNDDKLRRALEDIINHLNYTLVRDCKKHLGLTGTDKLSLYATDYIIYYFLQKKIKVADMMWNVINEYNTLAHKKDNVDLDYKEAFNALQTFYGGRKVPNNEINDIRSLKIIQAPSMWSIMCAACSRNARRKRDASIAFKNAIESYIQPDFRLAKSTISSNETFIQDPKEKDSLFQRDESFEREKSFSDDSRRHKSLTEVRSTNTDDLQLIISDQKPDIIKLIDTAIVTCKSQSNILDQKTDKKEVSKNGKEALFAFWDVYNKKNDQHVGSPQKAESTFLQMVKQNLESGSIDDNKGNISDNRSDNSYSSHLSKRKERRIQNLELIM